VSYPLPGTGFYEKVKDELSRKANWVDSDDLAMLFRNTYSSAYYRALHRFVHKKFRRKQAAQVARQLLRKPAQCTTARLYQAASILYYTPATLLAAAKWRFIERTDAA
jgi:anaerobic magnesium-protoporphyrin IX monomethyl ester cyclase